MLENFEPKKKPERPKLNGTGIIAVIILTILFWLLAKMTFGIGIWLTKAILVFAGVWFASNLLRIPNGIWKFISWIVGGILLWKYVVGPVMDFFSGGIWIAVVIGAAYLAYKMVIRSESCVKK
jgi:hypothetical protein